MFSVAAMYMLHLAMNTQKCYKSRVNYPKNVLKFRLITLSSLVLGSHFKT